MPHLFTRTWMLLGLLGVMSGCAALPSKTSGESLELRAERHLRDGCFTCLLQARDVYAGQVATGSASAAPKLFETLLLLTLRSQELALDPAEHLRAARALSSSLGPGAAVLVDRVAELPGDAAGTAVEDRISWSSMTAADRAQAQEVGLEATRAAGLTPATTEYLDITFRCAYAARATLAASSRDGTAGIPLIAYREAFCGNAIDRAALERVRILVPDFVEAQLFEARSEMVRLPNVDGVRIGGALEAALAQFPRSPAILLQLARLHQSPGECARALGYFSRRSNRASDTSAPAWSGLSAARIWAMPAAPSRMPRI